MLYWSHDHSLEKVSLKRHTLNMNQTELNIRTTVISEAPDGQDGPVFKDIKTERTIS